MNYAALGRYTDACSPVEAHRANVHKALSTLARQLSANFSPQPSTACVQCIDFPAMSKSLPDAQTQFPETTNAVQLLTTKRHGAKSRRLTGTAH
jgi:hypothetical protein